MSDEANGSTIEEQARKAIIAELERQAEIDPQKLRIEKLGDREIGIDGRIDLDALVMAVVGSLAGGP